jgi:hypothetical protein
MGKLVMFGAALASTPPALDASSRSRPILPAALRCSDRLPLPLPPKRSGRPLAPSRRAPPAAALLQDTQRPLYMQPRDAIEYGVIDGVVTPEKQIIDEVKSREQWDKDAGLVRQQG